MNTKMKNIVMLVMVLVFAIPCLAGTSVVGSYTWSFSYNSSQAAYRITGVSPATGDVETPSYVNNAGNAVPITQIGSEAFSGCSGLTGVSISYGVTVIYARAFENCSSLLSVSIPGSVENIYGYAFSGCSKLSSIVLPANLAAITEAMFYGCSSLHDITIPSKVTEIAAHAFSGCTSITNITIPSSVTAIGARAFKGCSNLSFIILNSTADIGTDAFTGCNLQTVFVADDNAAAVISKLQSSGLDTSMINVVPLSNVSIDGRTWSFKYISNLRGSGLSVVSVSPTIGNIKIPSEYGGQSVIAIGESFLEGASDTTGVSVPDSICMLGAKSFSGCSSVNELSFSAKVESVPTACFKNCIGLKSISLPCTGCVYVEADAFSGCTAISNVVYCPLQFTAKKAFPDSLSSIKSVSIPEGATYLAKNAFDGCGAMLSINLPSTLIAIPDYCFRYCGSLQSITIPSNVTTISSSAFSYCSNLQEVKVLGNITSLDSGAFYGCTDIKNVMITTDQYKTLQHWFPDGYTSITNVILNEGSTQIRSEMFNGCASLQSVTIPSTVTMIGSSAFVNCSTMQRVVFHGDAPDVGDGIFVGTPKRMTVYVPENSIGWNGDFTSDLPGSWEERAITHTMSTTPSSDPVVPAVTEHVYLTVTNVIVQYVLRSTQPEIAMPISDDAGFVNVITEIVSDGAVAVPSSWKNNYENFEKNLAMIL